MKAATVSEIKTELEELPPKKLIEICLRLAKYKKDNKELITYFLFESGDETSYIKGIKAEVDEMFGEINMSNIYFVKKSLRKILRTINKFIRYSPHKLTELELLIYFCNKLRDSRIPYKRHLVLSNLYDGQIKKIKKVFGALDEDLQYDYKEIVEELES